MATVRLLSVRRRSSSDSLRSVSLAGLGLAILCLLGGAAPPLAASDLRVTRVVPITDEGGRLSWSWTRNLVAFDRVGPDGFFDTWVMDPDGGNQRCLTCNATEITRRNNGNPAWHPSGDFLVFQAQKDVRVGPNGDNLARPGVGVNNDVWIMDAAGQRYWRVSNVPVRTGGVLHAHFSSDGRRLVWAERFAVEPLPSGQWRVMIADVSFTSGAPEVTNLRSLRPGAQGNLYETHGFSRDDRRILFAANLEPGQRENSIDIYSYGIETQDLVNLTGTFGEWDEHARPSPDGETIIWMSSVGAPKAPNALRTEYWAMDSDGSNKHQLTWFNDPRGGQFIPGGIVAGDSDWSADGSQLMAYLIEGGEGLGGVGRIVRLEFEAALTAVLAADFERGPLAPASLASVFGESLARGLAAAESTPLPTSLDGVSVILRDADDVERPAAIHSVSPEQVNVVVPAGVASGPAVLELTNHVGRKSRASVLIEAVSPGVFTANQTGGGVPAAVVQRVGPDGSTSDDVTFECVGGIGGCTARRIVFGQDRVFISLFGTGLRNRRSLGSVEVVFGGLGVPVLFAGAQSEFPGLDQIVIEAPPTLAGAGLVDVAVRVDGVPANVVQLRF